MRFVLAFALSASVFVAAGAAAYAGPASDAVMAFYAPIGTVSDPALREHFVDPARAKLEQNDKTPDGEIGCIDFSLAIDAQDMDEAEVARSLNLVEAVSGNEATVTASFRLFPGEKQSEREIVWSLVRMDGAWKVSDIAQSNGSWRLSDFVCE